MTTELERELVETLRVAEDGLGSIHTRLEAIAGEFAEYKEARQDQHLPDEKRELLRKRFEEMSDAELVGFLMSGQKLVEEWAYGRGCYIAEAHATALTVTLDRFAPEAFADALAVWFEHVEDEGDDA